jgi:hypothetical protein
MKKMLLIVFAFSIAVGTATAQDPPPYVGSIMAIGSQAHDYKLSAYEVGNYSGIYIWDAPPGMPIVAYFEFVPFDEMNTGWTAGPYVWDYVWWDGTYEVWDGPVSQSSAGYWTMNWGIFVGGQTYPLQNSNPPIDYFLYSPQLPHFTTYNSVPWGAAPPGLTGFTWPFSPVRYYSDSSIAAPSYLSQVASSYNAMLYYNFEIYPGYNFSQIYIHDVATTELPPGVYAQTYIGTYSAYDPGCTGLCSHACLNYSKTAAADMKLNVDLIMDNLSVWNIFNPTATADSVITALLFHEFGHVLGFNEATNIGYGGSGNCSEVQTIMYPYLDGNVPCSVYLPTSIDFSYSISYLYPNLLNWCPGIDFDFCWWYSC